MAWITRGLRNGILTTRYPRHPDPYADQFEGSVGVVVSEHDAGSAGKSNTERRLEERTLPDCPTGAISRGADGLPQLDRGRCILCGRCVDDQPDRFVRTPGSEVAVTDRRELLVPTPDQDLDEVRRSLAERTRRFRRSLHLRHIDLGSDGSEEWEITALLNPVYDIHRLGMFFTTTPRHADLLMITGAGSRAMIDPLRRTLEAMARPFVVMAVGTDAISGGMITPGPDGSSAVAAGISDLVPVDVWVPGSPPSPFMILSGLLLAVGRLRTRSEGTQ